MKSRNVRMFKLVLAAMFAALGCVATMVIQIPAPAGYVNLGDAVVLLLNIALLGALVLLTLFF